jgi:hypothetical protein
MPRICKSSHGEKVAGNKKYMFTGTLQGCAFCPRACQPYFVYRRNFNWPYACIYRIYYNYNLVEGGGPGF